jgi:hypothetical protein
MAIGGVADYYGSRRRMPQITQIAVRGIYAGDIYYILTEGAPSLPTKRQRADRQR